MIYIKLIFAFLLSVISGIGMVISLVIACGIPVIGIAILDRPLSGGSMLFVFIMLLAFLMDWILSLKKTDF